jgi:hypothetical protein
MSLRASGEGLLIIRQARMHKCWTVDHPRWLWEASQLLEPNVNWQPEEPFADGLSMPTSKRFLAGKESIKVPAFQIFCQVLGLNWQEVCSSNISRDVEESIRDFAVERSWRGVAYGSKITSPVILKSKRYEISVKN